jgi:hypothetical protein
MKKNVIRAGFIFVFFVVSIAVSVPYDAYAIPHTFNTLDEQSIAYGAGSGTAGSFGPAPFEITNNTGEVWTDFHLRLSWMSPEGISEGMGSLYFSNYIGPGTASLYNPGGSTNPYTLSNIDVVGLDIAIGATLDFSISGGHLGEQLPGAATLWVYAYPTTEGGGGGGGGVTVPEPATMFLFGTGLAGFGLLRKRFKA